MRDKAFSIAKNLKDDGYQRSFAWMVYKPFEKNTSGEAIKNENMCNKVLAEGLHKSIIWKFHKNKYTHFL